MLTPLPCERLLLGVTGSIHVVNLPQYLAQFRRTFARSIRVVMTGTTARMLPPHLVRTYIDEPVFTDLMGTDTLPSPHMRLTRWAQLFVVLPATADILGKAAHGIADDLLSTAILASPRPVVFAPAMNPAMWDSPAVRRNVAQLAADGHHMLPMRPITSVTTGEFDTGLGPTPESVMPHLWHLLMRQLKNDYWAEATATPPATPAEIKQSTNSQGAKALPLLPLLTADAADAPSASALPSDSPHTSDT